MLPDIFTRLGQVWPESAEQPCVLKVGNMYWLWFRPSAEENTYLIKSPNGRTGWGTPILVLSGNPADWENGVARPYQVLSVEETFYLYYGAGWPPQIGLATSIDGENFTRYSGNPILRPGEGGSWDDWGIGEFSVQVEAGMWKMLYKGYGSPAPGWAFFGLAESPDGKTWTKKGKVLSPDAEAGESIDLRAIHFILIQHYYYAFYSDSLHNDTFLASSANLEDWVHHGVAIPRPGPGSGAFDALWATAAYPLLDGSTVKLWYEAGDDDGLVTTGHVEVAVEDLKSARRLSSSRHLSVQRSPLILPDEIGGRGVVLLMPMNEGSGEPKDYSGHGNNGTRLLAGNPPLWVDGRFGKALSFDGLSQRVDCGDANSLRVDSLSALCWFKAHSLPSSDEWAGLLARAWEEGFSLLVRDSGLQYGVQTDDNGKVRKTYAFSPQLERWYFVALTYESGDFKGYLDGEPTVSETAWTGSIDDVGGFPILFGDSLGFVHYFDGIIDSVQIYDRALSPDEVKARYLGGRLLKQRGLGRRR